MDDTLKALKYAKEYVTHFFYLRGRVNNDDDGGDIKLHRSLQYLLVSSMQRVIDKFGEISREQVVMLIEAWVIAQGTASDHSRPYQQKLVPGMVRRDQTD